MNNAIDFLSDTIVSVENNFGSTTNIMSSSSFGIPQVGNHNTLTFFIV
jgi:hypothetical protein